jgi:carbon-monoxide dehydrogenase medium subunit
MKEIAYESPRTVAEAVHLLSEAKGPAKPLAGGTDILVQLRENLRDADLLVDIKRIPELTEIRQIEAQRWRIGAAASCSSIEANPNLAQLFPALMDAVHIIGGWQIKGRATLGGNLCTSSPAGDSLPALIACDATVEIAGPAGVRKIPVTSFCTGPGKNVLDRGEFVTAFEFDSPPPSSSGCYIRFIPRFEMDIAVVGAGVTLQVEGGVVRAARIALGAVAPTPILAETAAQALVGQPANLESFARAGQAAQTSAKPISDMRAPAEYRIHLVAVLVKRALAIAHRRLQGETVNPLKDGHF